MLYLLNGHLEHSLGEDRIMLQAGDSITIPAGMFHNAANVGSEDADMIVAFSSAHRDFELEEAARET